MRSSRAYGRTRRSSSTISRRWRGNDPAREDSQSGEHATLSHVGAGDAAPLPNARIVARRGDEVGDRARRSFRTAYPRNLSLCSGAGAERGARLRSALGEGRADRSARRRAGISQRQYRDEGGAEAGWHGGGRHDASEGGRAAGAALARGGRDHLHQDDDARLRHAVVGAIELPSAGAQPVEARPQSGRLVVGGGGGGGRALRSAPP